MTKREFLMMVVEKNITDEVLAYAQDEIEKMDDRNKNRKPSKAQIEKKTEDEAKRTTLLEILRNSVEPMTSFQLIEVSGFEVKPQKITALLTPLVADGKVVKTVIKKKTYYSIA